MDYAVVMAPIESRIAPGSHRVALAVEASLRAECGIIGELRGAIISVKHELVVIMPEIAAGRVDGLERVAAAVSKAYLNRPASCLLNGGGVSGRDDLDANGSASVCDIAGRAARRRGS